jgi:hypothetical protein
MKIAPERLGDWIAFAQQRPRIGLKNVLLFQFI